MEESTPEEKKKNEIIEKESNSNDLNNINENSEKIKILIEEIKNIINNINNDFDFKNFEQEKMDLIEKVIIFCILILPLNIVFIAIEINYIRK